MPHAATPGPLRAALSLLALSLLAACGGPSEELREIPVARRIPLGVEVSPGATLAVGEGGRLWVADGARLVALDTARGRPLFHVPLESTARVVQAGPRAVYLRDAETRLLAVDPGRREVRGRRPGVGEGGFALDPRGGVAYVAAPYGGVRGVEPGDLRPLWGWPERGVPGTALAVSPLGDRVYLALGGEEPRILVRDAQTGRVLGEAEARGEVRRLAVGPDGVLYALEEASGRGVLRALRPGAEELETEWSASVGELDPERPVRLAVSPVGDRVAVVTGDGALHLLDARTGRGAGGVREGVADAAFTPRGALYLLRPGRVGAP